MEEDLKRKFANEKYKDLMSSIDEIHVSSLRKTHPRRGFFKSFFLSSPIQSLSWFQLLFFSWRFDQLVVLYLAEDISFSI